MRKHTLIGTNFEYFVHGANPCLLLHAGTHGDEHEVIDIVTNAIKKFESRLPDFIYVPHVSPSAVLHKTRHNGHGLDSNRIYLDGSDIHEVIWNQEVMMMSSFDLAVSFHEDPEYSTYYIYDEGGIVDKSELIHHHNAYLLKNSISLLTGPDDIHDKSINQAHFVDGYKKFEFKEGIYMGDVLNWGMNKGIIKHALIPETPGCLSISEKTLIIDSFFEMVILKYFYR